MDRAWAPPTRRVLLQSALTGAATTLLAGCGAVRLRSPMPVAGGALTVGAAAADPEVGLPAQLDAVLAGLAARQAFSGAVLVSQAGRVLLRHAYGPAGAAATNAVQTPFHIASLTKAFTATAILQLRDAGQLRLQDPPAAYLDACPPAWKAITLQQLLLHTSGIPDYDGLPAYGPASGQHLTPAEVVGLFRDAPLDFAPGTRWAYSDSGYVLLGSIVERTSGLPYGDYLARRVFGPLQLAHTTYDTDPDGPPGLATGYASWGSPAAYADMSVQFAAGGVSSTVDDLHRWDRALLTGVPALAPPATVQEMFTPYVRTDPAQPKQSPSYGYAWVIARQGDHRLIWHPGNINGFVAFNGMYPDDGVAVVVLSNLETSDVRTIGTTLGGMVLGTKPSPAVGPAPA